MSKENRAKTSLVVALQAESVSVFRAIQPFFIFCSADKDSNDSAVPSGLEDMEELQNHGKALQILI